MKLALMFFFATYSAFAASNNSYLTLGGSRLNLTNLSDDGLELEKSFFKSIEYSQSISDSSILRFVYEFDEISEQARQIFGQYFSKDYGMIVERGNINGKKEGNYLNESNSKIENKEFEGSYTLISIYDTKDIYDVTFGATYARYQLPTQISVKVGNNARKYIDPGFMYQHFALSIYYDPLFEIKRKFSANEIVNYDDWYFRTISGSGLVRANLSSDFVSNAESQAGISKIKNDSYWGLSHFSQYELGWAKTFNVFGTNILLEGTYLARIHTMMFFSWLDEESDLSQGETSIIGDLLIMHGPQVKMTAVF